MIFYECVFFIGLHIGHLRLNDKMRLPLTKKICTVVGDSLMQFFTEVVVVFG
jgi:hypothetical protein